MKEFYGDGLLLGSASAKKIYAAVKALPIIDYHCHLDEQKIAENARFNDIGELWLSGDHYKWRAMRLCGIEEHFITGDADWHEKFINYARIVPLLAGNPLYYWTHMELRQVFGITEPLNAESAERIYARANERLKNISVGTLLKQFRVEYVATTNDPTDALGYHGVYDGVTVAPTFRPDKLYALDDEYLRAFGIAAGVEIETLDDLQKAIGNRLDHFVSKGCRISDHGFERFPKSYASYEEAKRLFARRGRLTAEEQDAFFGYLLVYLAKEYGKRRMLMQLHFAVIRNNNAAMFARCGADSGFDLIGEEQSVKDLIAFFNRVGDDERPETVVYTLNDGNLPALVAVTGAFRHVRAGAAWWFHDTVEGIRRNLSTIAEYAAIGTNFGMLTDSRSFSSYVRFDFFRRILSDYLGNLVEKGEYDEGAAEAIAKRICYDNIKDGLKG